MRIFLIIIFTTHFSFSQEIEFSKKYEPSGAKDIKTKAEIIDQGKKLLFSMEYQWMKPIAYHFIELTLSIDKHDCFTGRKNGMMIEFVDDSNIELMQFSETNCSDDNITIKFSLHNKENNKSTLYFRKQGENLEKLLTTKIEKIKIYGYEGLHDFIIDEEQQNVIEKHIHALIEEKNSDLFD